MAKRPRAFSLFTVLMVLTLFYYSLFNIDAARCALTDRSTSAWNAHQLCAFPAELTGYPPSPLTSDARHCVLCAVLRCVTVTVCCAALCYGYSLCRESVAHCALCREVMVPLHEKASRQLFEMTGLDIDLVPPQLNLTAISTMLHIRWHRPCILGGTPAHTLDNL